MASAGWADRSEVADVLLALILAGPKRATACLLRDVEAGGEMMARVGGRVVVLDGQDRSGAIWCTRTVEVKPSTRSMPPSPGTRVKVNGPRENWLTMDVRYFQRRNADEGFAFHAAMPAVFERFTLVWPPEYADPESA